MEFQGYFAQFHRRISAFERRMQNCQSAMKSTNRVGEKRGWRWYRPANCCPPPHSQMDIPPRTNLPPSPTYGRPPTHLWIGEFGRKGRLYRIWGQIQGAPKPPDVSILYKKQPCGAHQMETAGNQSFRLPYLSCVKLTGHLLFVLLGLELSGGQFFLFFLVLFLVAFQFGHLDGTSFGGKRRGGHRLSCSRIGFHLLGSLLLVSVFGMCSFHCS